MFILDEFADLLQRSFDFFNGSIGPFDPSIRKVKCIHTLALSFGSQTEFQKNSANENEEKMSVPVSKEGEYSDAAREEETFQNDKDSRGQ